MEVLKSPEWQDGPALSPPRTLGRQPSQNLENPSRDEVSRGFGKIDFPKPRPAAGWWTPSAALPHRTFAVRAWFDAGGISVPVLAGNCLEVRGGVTGERIGAPHSHDSHVRAAGEPPRALPHPESCPSSARAVGRGYSSAYITAISGHQVVSNSGPGSGSGGTSPVGGRRSEAAPVAGRCWPSPVEIRRTGSSRW